MDEQIVGPEPDIMIDPALAHSELVQDRAYSERRKYVRGDLKTELASDRPRLFVYRVPQIYLAAHDHRDELIGRREELPFDPDCILGICVSWAVGPRALEVAERRTTPRVEQGLDGGVGVLWRVVNLRDVVHGRDTVVELTQRAEQLVDVHILRPVHGGRTSAVCIRSK